MTDTVKAVFLVGTLGLAAGTGTLGSLVLVGGFSYVVYLVTTGMGGRRIRTVMLEEERRLKRIMAFLDRFLDKQDYQGKKGAWACDDAVADLMSMFQQYDAQGNAIRVLPTWEMLIEAKQEVEHRLSEMADCIKSRVPKNKLAGAMAGCATFLYPWVGVAAIAYQVYRMHMLRRERNAALSRKARNAIKREFERVAKEAAEQEERMRQQAADYLNTDVSVGPSPYGTPAGVYYGGPMPDHDDARP